MAEPALEERVARLEGKTESFDARFDGIDRRLDALDQKVDRFREELGCRIDALDQKIDRNFQWTTGINVVLWSTILVALFFRT